MIQFLDVIKFLGVSWSGGGLWSAICIFMLLLDERIFTNGDCMIRPPPKSYKFDIIMEGFMWNAPKDNLREEMRFVPEGTAVTFFCENGFVDDNFPAKIYKFVCTGKKYNDTYYYEDLFCKSDFHKNTKTHLISTVQLGSEIFKCEGRSREVYQVGTKQPDGSFRPLYKACFDANVMRTKFVYQPRSALKLDYVDETEVRWDVWGFDHFGKSTWERIKLSDGYVSRLQAYRTTVQYPDKYSKENLYPHTFCRGHLATFAHFYTPDDRKSTCLYINAAPQWKILNKFTWKWIEYEIKDLIMENPYAWEIYTGTYGSLLTARGTPLFVSPFFDERGKLTGAYVPVPRLFWKFVQNMYDEKLSRVFIGVNSPDFKSEKEITPEFLICKPIPRKGRKIRGGPKEGFAYECNVKEFLAKLSMEEKIIKEQ